jgi:hypothetical protein
VSNGKKIVNDELEGFVWCYRGLIEALSRHLPGGAKEILIANVPAAILTEYLIPLHQPTP